MPFPTHQGTQAVIHRMLEASVDAGIDPHLLTYARGGRELVARYHHHRVGDFPRVTSLRSGPSVGKLALDMRLAVHVRKLGRRVTPWLWVAHHVEAALACLGQRPALFFAHTDLALELPSYAHARWSSLLERAGGRLDAWLARNFGIVATISPLLASRLQQRLGENVHVRWVPAPWRLPPPVQPEERARARSRFGLARGEHALLYAGNLDAYQGWQALVAAVAQLRAREAPVRLTVATASDPAPLHALARQAALAHAVQSIPLGDESRLRALYAAADVALVPRSIPGGLPIKLLDALSRGVPTVLAPAAAAGLPLGDAAVVAAASDGPALASAVGHLLERGESRARTAERARAYVAEHHDPARFAAVMEALGALARGASRHGKFLDGPLHRPHGRSGG